MLTSPIASEMTNLLLLALTRYECIVVIAHKSRSTLALFHRHAVCSKQYPVVLYFPQRMTDKTVELHIVLFIDCR